MVTVSTLKYLGSANYNNLVYHQGWQMQEFTTAAMLCYHNYWFEASGKIQFFRQPVLSASQFTKVVFSAGSASKRGTSISSNTDQFADLMKFLETLLYNRCEPAKTHHLLQLFIATLLPFLLFYLANSCSNHLWLFYPRTLQHLHKEIWKRKTQLKKSGAKLSKTSRELQHWDPKPNDKVTNRPKSSNQSRNPKLH